MTHEGLPKQFISSVRVLFDVLDSSKVGYVDFRDIEVKWNRESTDKLPADVVECLRSVTPSNGCLTFELFVAGLQRSLKLQKSTSDEVFDNASPPPKPQKPTNLQQKNNYITPDQQRANHSPSDWQIANHNAVHQRNGDQIYQRPRTIYQLDGSGRAQSLADIPAQPITSPQHRPTYRESDAYKRHTPKRRESSRRHTLGHGVDGSMVRRSKLLEEERRMLLKGLQSADKAKEWYTKRLAEVAEKQRYGAPETSDQSSTDQQQERINFEQLRINELNQQIDGLTEPSPQGGLMRMNLARPTALQGRQQTIPYEPNTDGSSSIADAESAVQATHTLQLLKAQNRLLTKEMSQKGDRISQLEKDKSALLKDLFEVRAKHRVQQHQQQHPPQRHHPSIPPPRQFDESTLM